MGSINLSRSYEGTNSFSGQSSPIHAMGWQELLSKMQSTVAPPLAYAWPPRFIFVNPLPAGSPSRPTVEICPKEIQEMKNYWTGPVQSFKQQFLIYDSLFFGTWNRWAPFRACLVKSFLVMVVVEVAVIRIVLVMLSLLEQIPWLPAAWLPPPLSYSSKPRPN